MKGVSMTENEAIKAIEHDLEWHSKELQPKYKEVLRYTIQALEEIQQYRAIGLTPELIEAMQGHNIAMINDLEEYQAIGTIEELKALKEKNVAKKVIVKKSEKIELDVCDEKGNVHLCPNCNDYIICADMKHCSNCGQALEH